MAEEPVTDELTCGDIMRTPVVKARMSTTVMELARMMKEERVGSVVIVDDRDVLLGIVTKTDIVYLVAEGRDPRYVAAEHIMKREPFFVYKDTPVREAAELMGYYDIGHLPVLDRETSKVVGMISKSDIIKLAPDYMMMAYALLRGR